MITAQTIEDQQLLEGILNADNQKIKLVYDLALPAVITYVKENSGTEADARDIFQDALLALFRKLEAGNFKLTCTLKSFLRIMCRNLWLTKLRNNKKFETNELKDVEEIDLGDDLLTQLEQSEKRKLFFKHFNALGESCKKILLFYFDKVPVKEIAIKLETSESYVKKRKFKCKESLIKHIQKDPVFKEL